MRKGVFYLPWEIWAKFDIIKTRIHPEWFILTKPILGKEFPFYWVGEIAWKVINVSDTTVSNYKYVCLPIICSENNLRFCLISLFKLPFLLLEISIQKARNPSSFSFSSQFLAKDSNLYNPNSSDLLNMKTVMNFRSKGFFLWHQIIHQTNNPTGFSTLCLQKYLLSFPTIKIHENRIFLSLRITLILFIIFLESFSIESNIFIGKIYLKGLFPQKPLHLQ